MKPSDRYHKWIEWSEEDSAYLGKCPDLRVVIHGPDPVRLYTELREVVDEIICHFEAEGRLLPSPRVRPMQEIGSKPSISQFFRESPLAGLDLTRDRSVARPAPELKNPECEVKDGGSGDVSEDAGVLLSAEEYEGLMETLDILSDPELSHAVQAGLEEAAQGRLVSHEEVWNAVDDPVDR
jgi:predicted RNase H-like HicB family nuclease